MSSLKLQKRLAASVMRCGRKKVWLDPNEVNEIANTNSRQNIRKLIKDGLIIKKPVAVHSRARVRKNTEARRKGRHCGFGKRKGTANARMPQKSNLEHDTSVRIRLQHALKFSDNPHFTDRSNVTIQSLRLGQASIDQKPLTLEEKSQLRDLAANNDYYQVKAIVTAGDGSERTFISTAKACMLVEAELDDRLSVFVDYIGRVIGVTLVIASRSTCEGAIVPVDQLKGFTTTVYVKHTDMGPIPDTASYIQKLEREREAKEKGEVKDNRSFLAKYWMYIIPVVIIMALSSAANPDAQQGQ
ncbi:hypothetical protein NQ315_012164 [Exocentrus adspersus]|uniref:Ribosomal protein L19 n=1 Tax=Exocentrus adspersus TaxID=1586481 RepID=A0AAV8VY18_9CUCU|nr:hypothetical protein NQ315_012164 [Exocentrus adspersus]